MMLMMLMMLAMLMMVKMLIMLMILVMLMMLMLIMLMLMLLIVLMMDIMYTDHMKIDKAANERQKGTFVFTYSAEMELQTGGDQGGIKIRT